MQPYSVRKMVAYELIGIVSIKLGNTVLILALTPGPNWLLCEPDAKSEKKEALPADPEDFKGGRVT